MVTSPLSRRAGRGGWGLSSGQFDAGKSRHGNPMRNCGVLHVPSLAPEVSRVGSVAIVACVASARRSGATRGAGDAGAGAGYLRHWHDLGWHGPAPPGGRRAAAGCAGAQHRAPLAPLAANPQVTVETLWRPLLPVLLRRWAGHEVVLVFDPTPHRADWTVLWV